MPSNRDSIRDWVLAQFAERFAAAFEGMLGVRPKVVRVAEPPPRPESGGLNWHQPFAGAPGAAWIYASAKDWTEGAKQVLHAAGLDDADQATLKSTWLEVLGQALSGIAQDFTAELGREVTCAAGTAVTDSLPLPAAQFAVEFAGDLPGSFTVMASIEDALLDSLSQEAAASQAAAASASGDDPVSTAPSGQPSKTFDLLLDVELPVSVSFGRAQVPLKDVIKLTTGAIVELNRSITEPVEVIVNNCVIARGEVVVVEGNFGVRINEVISRQERLRTLH